MGLVVLVGSQVVGLKRLLEAATIEKVHVCKSDCLEKN